MKWKTFWQIVMLMLISALLWPKYKFERNIKYNAITGSITRMYIKTTLPKVEKNVFDEIDFTPIK